MLETVKKMMPVRLQVAFGWASSERFNDGVHHSVAIRSLTMKSMASDGLPEKKRLIAIKKNNGLFTLKLEVMSSRGYSDLSDSSPSIDFKLVGNNVSKQDVSDVVSSFNFVASEWLAKNKKLFRNRVYYPFYEVFQRLCFRTEHRNQNIDYFEVTDEGNVIIKSKAPQTVDSERVTAKVTRLFSSEP